ncbi:MAG: ABC transporter ATP-binding protein [Nanoarchaeota archaeon]
MRKLIQLKEVNITRKGKRILNNISWTVKENENWAIIGKNGSGKSFLLKILSANMQPSSGSVEIFGQEFGKISLWEFKKQIGFVSDFLQKQHHENIKVIEVVLSGFYSSIGVYQKTTTKMISAARKILKSLEINSLKDRVFGELSHGEQRKVLIARALVFNPKLLVMDEPCTGLDIPTKEEFLTLINKLAKSGHNIIFVTHHIDEITGAINRVLLIKDGKIIKQGIKKEIMKENLLNKVLGYKFKLTQKQGRYWANY